MPKTQEQYLINLRQRQLEAIWFDHILPSPEEPAVVPVQAIDPRAPLSEDWLILIRNQQDLNFAETADWPSRQFILSVSLESLPQTLDRLHPYGLYLDYPAPQHSKPLNEDQLTLLSAYSRMAEALGMITVMPAFNADTETLAHLIQRHVDYIVGCPDTMMRLPQAKEPQEDELQQESIGFLMRHHVAVGLFTPAAEVILTFNEQPDLPAMAVVDEELRPLGIIERETLLERSSGTNPIDIQQQTVEQLTDADPVIIEANIPFDTASRMLTKPQHRHQKNLILTNQGRFVGVVTIHDLLRRVTTQMKQYEQYAHPLTQLPGLVPFKKAVLEQLDRQRHFHVVYFELNHFVSLI